MKVKLFQDGGPMPAEPGMAPEAAPAGAPAPAPGAEGGMNPEEIAQNLTDQIMQQFGPEFALMLADKLQQAAQGGGAPMPPPEAQPAFQRQGGRLHRIH